MPMIGIPQPTQPPEFDVETFKLFIPKLAWYVSGEEIDCPQGLRGNIALYNKAVEIMKNKLNYGYWLEEWEEAMSLAVAHFIIITDPMFSQSTDADSTAGGVMRSRSVAGVSYDYDIEYYIDNNIGSKYWNTTGYGRRLIDLMNSRGWIGVIQSV